jgi:hypothetical protein
MLQFVLIKYCPGGGMVDTGDLKSPAYGVPVRVRSRVPRICWL